MEANEDRCAPETVGEEDGPIVAVYEVNDAMLGPLCYGAVSTAAVDAWASLQAIAPDGFLDPVVSLSGFDFDGEPDIIAFAVQLDEVGDQFAVAVEVDEAASDPEELQLTMVHELAHVFTQVPDQFEFDAEEAGCEGYHTYYGCFSVASYINQWVTEFWSPEAIASLPEDGSTDEDGGDERCLVNPAFPGAYAASHPEEDFAESFAAYVFTVDLPDGVDSRLEFFTRYPELVAFRTNAEALGLSGLPNNYDECG